MKKYALFQTFVGLILAGAHAKDPNTTDVSLIHESTLELISCKKAVRIKGRDVQ